MSLRDNDALTQMIDRWLADIHRPCAFYDVVFRPVDDGDASAGESDECDCEACRG
jgi:hypothetical protein